MGTVLRQILHQRHYAGHMRIHEIHRAWPRIVGPLLAGRSAPLSLRSGRLTIGVSDSVWLQELSFLRAEILEQVRACLATLGGEEGGAKFAVVEDVRFRLVPGAGEPPAESRRGARADPPRDDLIEGTASVAEPSGVRTADGVPSMRPAAPLPEEVADAVADFETHLDRIEDPALRQQIRRAFISACLRPGGRDPVR